MLDGTTQYYLIGTCAFAIGSVLVLHNMVKDGLSFPQAVIVWTLSVYGGLAGTRVLYLLATDAHGFLANPLAGVVFWQGNLSWQGGPLAGVIVAAAVLLLFRKPVWTALGSAAPGLALAHGLARFACLARGCCYGSPTDMPWGVFNEWTQRYVHPTQVYDMLCEFAVAAALQCLWRVPARRKYLMPLYGILYGMHRFVTEYFRGAPSGVELVPGLRFYQSMCLVLILVSAIAALALFRPKLGLLAGLLAALVAVLALLATGTGTGPAPGIPIAAGRSGLVVTRRLFEEAAMEWAAAQERGGTRVHVKAWDTEPPFESVRSWISMQANDGTAWVLVIGDARSPGEEPTEWSMPGEEIAITEKGRKLAFLSDSGYSRGAGDEQPTMPIGRLPVRTVAQLRSQFSRIAMHEQRPAHSIAPRIVIWAGTPDGEDGLDAAVQDLLDALPDGLRATVVPEPDDGNSRASSYQRFLDELAQPVFASFLAGHGSSTSVCMNGEGDLASCITATDVDGLLSVQPSGPLFIMACDSGDFALAAEAGPCLAEAFLLHPCGPICVLAASGTTTPIMNLSIACALAAELSPPPGTVGGLWTRAQRRLLEWARRAEDDRANLSTLTGMEMPFPVDEAELPVVLRAAAGAYNLLGFPGVRL